MGTPAFRDSQGIHDKDGVGTTGKGHEEARELRRLKIMEDARQAPEKKKCQLPSRLGFISVYK